MYEAQYCQRHWELDVKEEEWFVICLHGGYLLRGYGKEGL